MTTNNFRVSEDGLRLIKRLEGFKAKAYQCSAGRWTIGYGFTHGVKEGDTVTKEKAQQDLEIYANRVGEFINKTITVPLTQYQFDALVSFVYNIGENAFRNSQVHQLINHNCLSQVPFLMARWKYVTQKGEKVESLGLITRRKLEGQMWEDGTFDQYIIDSQFDPQTTGDT